MRPPDSRQERGATALMVAITMTLIMGIAAVVVDLGRAFDEKRQAQSGTDFAALAALPFAVGPNPADAGATEAMAVVQENLPWTNFTAANWLACTDPGRPAEYVNVSSLTPCVSFTENFEQSRVRLPIDDVDTTFGAVIRFGSIQVRSETEAIRTSKAIADVVPYTAPSGSSVCLFSNQAPQAVPPCDGPNSGFFGYLDVALHGSIQLGTPPTCEQGTANVRTAINLAKGSDHDLAEWDTGDPVVDDWTPCPNVNEKVNQLHVQTGSPTQATTDGLINGVSGSINGQPFGATPGRLNNTIDPSGLAAVNVRGINLNNTPLWHYLLNPTCPWGSPISGAVNTFQEMKDCLDDWTPAQGSIFQLQLDDQPRFAAVPIFTAYPTGPGAYVIDFFSPVYIETTYQNCNANRCHTIFSAGETGGSTPCPNPLAPPAPINCGHSHTSGSDDIEGLTAFQLKLGMLDPLTQQFFPGTKELGVMSLLK